MSISVLNYTVVRAIWSGHMDLDAYPSPSLNTALQQESRDMGGHDPFAVRQGGAKKGLDVGDGSPSDCSHVKVRHTIRHLSILCLNLSLR